jgi:hypothetical protein
VSPGESGALIDELLDRAVRAINEGDRATATTLAGQVLSVDHGNPEAEDLLSAPAQYGEIRRLTIMFADLVSADPPVQSVRARFNVGSDGSGGDHRQWGDGRKIAVQ